MTKWLFCILLIAFSTFKVGQFAVRDPRPRLLLLRSFFGSERDRLKAHNKPFKAVLGHFNEEIRRREALKLNVQCSYQIYRELRWLIDFSFDEVAIHNRISALESTLVQTGPTKNISHTPDQRGGYGGCYSEWFMKMWQIAELTEDNNVEYRVSNPETLHSLDLINSPAKLSTYLTSVLTTNFDARAEFTRVSADDSISGLGRLILRGQPKNYSYDPDLKNAYQKFFDQWQDPQTGMWGVRYKVGPFMISTPDTGITFHILSQRRCVAEHLDKMAQTLLKLEHVDFPFGWRVNGKYENHMNWDAVQNYRCAWPQMSESTRAQVRRQIQGMLDWSLQESISPEGNFKTSELDDTNGDATENGLNFLDDVGYFSKRKRFWADQNFMGSRDLLLKIKKQIVKMDLKDPHFMNAYKHLMEIEVRLD